jgi:hypothetical protein
VMNDAVCQPTADSHAKPNRFNSGDAVQIGTAIGMAMMTGGFSLLDALFAGVASCLAIFMVMAIIRTLKQLY